MAWTVEIADEFEPEFDALPEDARMEILALSLLLEQFGPHLGRPRVDTLKGSRYPNMKELRFSAAHGEWPSPLIRGVGPFCLLQGINRAVAKSAFIAI